MKINLEKLIKNYGGKWIALNKNLDKVVVSGNNAKKVFEKAKDKGYKIPTLFKVPTRLIAYIGSLK